MGDIFALSAEILGEVDAVYDRAALVALPETLRQQYTAHLIQLTHRAPQLLICYEYDQGVMSGPPFSVNDEEVKQHYAAPYHISLLDSVAVEGGLRGQCDAVEDVWLLQP